MAEAAYVLDVTAPTLSARFREHPEVAAAWRRGKAIATMTTRRLVWWHAQRPDGSGTRAALFLAKQLLWADEPLQERDGAGAEPREVAGLSAEERSALNQLLNKLSGVS